MLMSPDCLEKDPLSRHVMSVDKSENDSASVSIASLSFEKVLEIRAKRMSFKRGKKPMSMMFFRKALQEREKSESNAEKSDNSKETESSAKTDSKDDSPLTSSISCEDKDAESSINSQTSLTENTDQSSRNNPVIVIDDDDIIEISEDARVKKRVSRTQQHKQPPENSRKRLRPSSWRSDTQENRYTMKRKPSVIFVKETRFPSIRRRVVKDAGVIASRRVQSSVKSGGKVLKPWHTPLGSEDLTSLSKPENLGFVVSFLQNLLSNPALKKVVENSVPKIAENEQSSTVTSSSFNDEQLDDGKETNENRRNGCGDNPSTTVIADAQSDRRNAQRRVVIDGGKDNDNRRNESKNNAQLAVIDDGAKSLENRRNERRDDVQLVVIDDDEETTDNRRNGRGDKVQRAVTDGNRRNERTDAAQYMIIDGGKETIDYRKNDSTINTHLAHDGKTFKNRRYECRNNSLLIDDDRKNFSNRRYECRDNSQVIDDDKKKFSNKRNECKDNAQIVVIDDDKTLDTRRNERRCTTQISSIEDINQGVSNQRREHRSSRWDDKGKRNYKNFPPRTVKTHVPSSSSFAGVSSTATTDGNATFNNREERSAAAYKGVGLVETSYHFISENILYEDRAVKKGLRPIVIDGSNIAMTHGKGRVFSVRGLKICIDFFLKRDHKVYAFIPHYRLKKNESDNQRLLMQLVDDHLVFCTSSREVFGKRICSYDDRILVQVAAAMSAVIVSSDNYRDLLLEDHRLIPVIQNNLLMPTWVDDMIIFPQDPLGRFGPKLDAFLRYP